MKANVTVTSVTVVTMKFVFGICNCMVDSDIRMGEFWLVLGILHGCTCLLAWTAMVHFTLRFMKSGGGNHMLCASSSDVHAECQCQLSVPFFV